MSHTYQCESYFDMIQNSKILTASIKFVVDSDRFTSFIFYYRKLLLFFAFASFYIAGVKHAQNDI